MNVVLGNIIGSISAVLFCASTFFKNKKQIILVQTIDCLCGITCNLLLGSLSGVTTILVSLIRNILIYFDKATKLVRYILLIFTIALGIILNNIGIIGIVPIIASVELAVVTMYSNNIKYIKIATGINAGMWVIHDLYVQNYVCVILNTISALISIINAFRIDKEIN